MPADRGQRGNTAEFGAGDRFSAGRAREDLDFQIVGDADVVNRVPTVIQDLDDQVYQLVFADSRHRDACVLFPRFQVKWQFEDDVGRFAGGKQPNGYIRFGEQVGFIMACRDPCGAVLVGVGFLMAMCTAMLGQSGF